MAPSQGPKYRAIYEVLRRRILDGELAPGEKLPPQQELAESFGVTLMTLRQAMSALETESLIRAEQGKGTFVADRPVDISLGNLSSFAAQMQSAGRDMVTELLHVEAVPAEQYPAAAVALEVEGTLARLTRRRSVGGEPISLQRSFLDRALDMTETIEKAAGAGESLYDAIEASTGWTITEARESITAVALDRPDAVVLDVETGHPALLSIRTSLNQFGRPYLYDEALLVGGRCTIAANRSSNRLSLEYDLT